MPKRRKASNAGARRSDTLDGPIRKANCTSRAHRRDPQGNRVNKSCRDETCAKSSSRAATFRLRRRLSFPGALKPWPYAWRRTPRHLGATCAKAADWLSSCRRKLRARAARPSPGRGSLGDLLAQWLRETTRSQDGAPNIIAGLSLAHIACLARESYDNLISHGSSNLRHMLCPASDREGPTPKHAGLPILSERIHDEAARAVHGCSDDGAPWSN
jgi:hypothetical protein